MKKYNNEKYFLYAPMRYTSWWSLSFLLILSIAVLFYLSYAIVNYKSELIIAVCPDGQTCEVVDQVRTEELNNYWHKWCLWKPVECDKLRVNGGITMQEVEQQEFNRMSENAQAKANQLNGVISSLMNQRAEEASEQYVSENGFEGEDRENRKSAYIEVFKESIIVK